MATEILKNDGGAPARFPKFTANAAIGTGYAVQMHSDGKVKLAVSGATHVLGYALIAAAANDPVTVITGRGVILNARVSGTIDEGDPLMVSPAGGGVLISGTTNGPYAVALEANASGGPSLKLVFTSY